MPVTENLYPFVEYQAQAASALSFLQERFTDLGQWRDETWITCARFPFAPDAVDLSPELADFTEYHEYSQQKWYITTSPGERMPVLLLVPRE